MNDELRLLPRYGLPSHSDEARSRTLPNPEDPYAPFEVECDNRYSRFNRNFRLRASVDDPRCHRDAPEHPPYSEFALKAMLTHKVLELAEHKIEHAMRRAARSIVRRAAGAVPLIGVVVYAWEAYHFLHESGVANEHKEYESSLLNLCASRAIETFQSTTTVVKCAPCPDDSSVPCFADLRLDGAPQGFEIREAESDDPCRVACEVRFWMSGAVACFCPTDWIKQWARAATTPRLPPSPATPGGAGPTEPPPAKGAKAATTEVPDDPVTGPVPAAPPPPGSVKPLPPINSPPTPPAGSGGGSTGSDGSGGNRGYG